jgi:hypothetical protein
MKGQTENGAEGICTMKKGKNVKIEPEAEEMYIVKNKNSKDTRGS